MKCHYKCLHSETGREINLFSSILQIQFQHKVIHRQKRVEHHEDDVRKEKRENHMISRDQESRGVKKSKREEKRYTLSH